MRTLRVAIGQVNPTVGDLDGNVAMLVQVTERAAQAGADLVAFPELAVTGYPPEDLVLQPAFVEANLRALDRFAEAVRDTAAVVGFVDRDAAGVYNAAAVVADGVVKGVYRKQALPNYGVFDERRTFVPGTELPLFDVAGVRIAVTICEDLWVASGPVGRAPQLGAECVVNVNASPFHRGKALERQILVHQRSVDGGVAIVYAQTVGGQDELVFDGGSLVFDRTGKLVGRGSQFLEDLVVCDLEFPDSPPAEATSVISVSGPRTGELPALEPATPLRAVSAVEEVYEALLVGTRDYVRKNGFPGAIVGMSGGIDSALTATIASDALGPENVLGVAMPSAISAGRSLEDAKETATNLGIDFVSVPIADLVEKATAVLRDPIGGEPRDITTENLQSRIRGLLLMGLSNDSGRIVLTTGNKSEIAVGYATLYGDMAGGFAVLKDVPKTLVYELARYRNATGLTAIPEQVLTRPPSAELRPGQEDTDRLPPYEVLDPIIELAVEKRRSRDEIVAAGFAAEVVDDVLSMIAKAEYKRRQAPPGVKITPLSFGRDRRMPITNRF